LVAVFQLAEMISGVRFIQYKSSRKAQNNFFCDATGRLNICWEHVCITESVTDETAREVNGDKRVVAVSLVTFKA
jgi:hypothetical protein